MILVAAALQVQAAGVVREFPFEFREGLIWVQVSVPQRAKPLNFLLDTGAGVSVVNLRTAQQLGLNSGKPVSVQGVGGRTRGFWPEHLTAQTGGVPLPKDYLAVDLSLLSGACECPVDGLIGADFFRNQVVQIDFAAGKVRLLEKARSQSGEATVLPLKQGQGALRVPVSLDQGVPQWVRLDTGCASSLQWVTGAGKNRAYPRQMAVALTGVSIAVAPATVHLGGLCFEGVSTGLHEKSIFSGEAGLLGNGLLSRFASVIIDAPSGRVLLQR